MDTYPKRFDSPARMISSAGSDSPVRRDDGILCPLCEADTLTTRHCKRICESCGYIESCEDNFLPTQQNKEHRAHHDTH